MGENEGEGQHTHGSAAAALWVLEFAFLNAIDFYLVGACS